jgi:serine protease inhibitor
VDDTQPILFEANRPFTFVIRELSTGVILFMGYMEQL